MKHFLIILCLSQFALTSFACFERVERIVFNKKDIESVIEFAHHFPVDNDTLKKLQELPQDKQKQIYDFFSEVRSPNRLMNNVLFRKGAIRKVINIIIDDQTDYGRIIIKGMKNRFSLNRHEKRALHLMLHKKWWFEGYLTKERGDLSFGIDNFLDFVRPTYYVDRYLVSDSTRMNQFLNETTQRTNVFTMIPKFAQKLTNGLNYLMGLKSAVQDTAHLTGFTNKLKEMNQDLIVKIEATEDPKKLKDLEKQHEHIKQMLRLFDRNHFATIYQRRFPNAGNVVTTGAQGIENTVLFFGKLYVLYYFLNKYLSIDSILMTDVEGEQTIEIDAQDTGEGTVIFDPSKQPAQDGTPVLPNQGNEISPEKEKSFDL